MPGNYSFLEDWTGGDENVPRRYRVGPCYLEDEEGNGNSFTNAIINTSNNSGTKIPNKNTVKVDGIWLDVRSGIGVQQQYFVSRSMQVGTPTTFPDISEGKALLEKVVSGKSTRYQEKLARLEIEAKAKADADAKAATERAAAEANAKAEADAKAKIEAARAAELKAKQEAEARAKAAAEKKKTTITCTKGKLTKKVTAVNPKCPAGYKKK